MNIWMITGVIAWILLLSLALVGNVKINGVQVDNPLSKIVSSIGIGFVIIIVFLIIGAIGYAMATPIAYLMGIKL